MSKTILIIGAGAIQAPLILRAREMGLRVVATDRNPSAPGMALADIAEVVDTRDFDGTLKVAEKHHIDGVTTSSDFPVRTAAHVAAKLGLPGISMASAVAATDKYEMRKMLTAAGCPVPGFARAATGEEAAEAARAFGFPLIVKPPDKSGSRGVSLVENESQLSGAFERALSQSGEGFVVVEEFMRGEEISVETFSHGGKTEIIALTGKITTGAPFFVEMGHIVPIEFEGWLEEKIHAVALRAVEAMGIGIGPTHTELMIDECGDVKIVEVGARLGGDFITTKLVPYALGVDMAGAVVSAFTGGAPDLSRTRSDVAVVKFLEAPEGILKAVTGLDKARAMDGILDAELLAEIGGAVSALGSSMDRAAYVVARATTREEALTKAENAADLIGFEL